MHINIWLSRPATEDLSVNWQTLDDTALARVDYTPGSGVISEVTISVDDATVTA